MQSASIVPPLFPENTQTSGTEHQAESSGSKIQRVLSHLSINYEQVSDFLHTASHRLAVFTYSKVISLLKCGQKLSKQRHCYLVKTVKTGLEEDHLPQAITGPAEPLPYAQTLALIYSILGMSVKGNAIFKTLGFSLECAVAGIPIIIIANTLLSLWLCRHPMLFTNTCLNMIIRRVRSSLISMVITLVVDKIYNLGLDPAVELFDSCYIARLTLACVLALILVGLLIWKSVRLNRPVEPSPYNTLTGCLIMGSALNAEEDLIKHYIPEEGFEYSKREQECKYFARHYNYKASPPLYDTQQFVTKIAYLHAVAPTISGNFWLKNPYLKELEPELPESHGEIYLQIIKWKLPWDKLSSTVQENYKTKAELINGRQANS